MMTKDMDSLSYPNTGQELKFIQFYTHLHPTIYSCLKSTKDLDEAGIKIHGLLRSFI